MHVKGLAHVFGTSMGSVARYPPGGGDNPAPASGRDPPTRGAGGQGTEAGVLSFLLRWWRTTSTISVTERGAEGQQERQVWLSLNVLPKM